MKRVAALIAIMVGLLAAVPGLAVAQPAGDVALRLDLADLSPRVVTASGPAVLTVTGTLHNTGDVAVGDIGARLQRGDALRTEAAVREALAGDAPTDATAPQFQDLGGAGSVTNALAPGEDAPVRLTVPLRGAPETGLALSGTGVYELLVNVNGAPVGGDRARLAAVRLLLPVLGLPAGPDGSDPVPADGGAPDPVSVLVPLADQPRRLTTVPGSPALLSDDVLAGEFGPDGRLGGLVAALAEAPGTACVAVDPDLVQTVAAMRTGYEVLLPDGSRVPGSGADAAGSWLDALRAAVAGRCVLALPFADADLVALTRAGLGDLAAESAEEGREIVEATLGTPVLPSTTWPAGGVVDDATADALGGDTLVLAAAGIDLPSRTAPRGAVRTSAGGTALVTDPLLATAADPAPAARGDRAGGQAAATASASGALASQDVLGALAFRAAGDDRGPLLLALPRRADAASTAALFAGLDTLVDAGAITARDPADTLAATPEGPARDLVYPLDAGAAEVAPVATGAIRDALADLDDLASSAVDGDQAVDPDDVFDPLRLETVRAASAAWRGAPPLAEAAARSVRDRVAAVRASVSVLEPPTPFSLGTSDAPLLLTVANGLPVTMRVRVELASTSGLRVAPIPAVEVPPLGRRQVQANAEVLRSGVFTVDAAVLSEDGGRLGPPSRLQVRSTAYGTITLWLTGTAGILLVVLAGRRILRRIRSEPAGRTDPTPDPPTPSPPPRGSHPEDPAVWTTVPVRRPGPSSAPTRPGPPTGPYPPARSAPASAPAGGAPTRPATPPRPAGSP